MEVDAEVETEAERRRARPQGHRDEREASATMAAAAAAQRRVEAASERKEGTKGITEEPLVGFVFSDFHEKRFFIFL
jgi:hypothetical protein